MTEEKKDLSGNGVSSVWLDDDGTIHKVQPKYLCDNEWWALDTFRYSGFVPQAERIGLEEISMEFIVSEEITSIDLFKKNCDAFLWTIYCEGVRHGDLTVPHVFVVNNSPVVIDWAESRYKDDPRPDKRREGDRYWWHKAIGDILSGKH